MQMSVRPRPTQPVQDSAADLNIPGSILRILGDPVPLLFRAAHDPFMAAEYYNSRGTTQKDVSGLQCENIVMLHFDYEFDSS
jgi:hypothetical protein